MLHRTPPDVVSTRWPLVYLLFVYPSIFFIRVSWPIPTQQHLLLLQLICVTEQCNTLWSKCYLPSSTYREYAMPPTKRAWLSSTPSNRWLWHFQDSKSYSSELMNTFQFCHSRAQSYSYLFRTQYMFILNSVCIFNYIPSMYQCLKWRSLRLCSMCELSDSNVESQISLQKWP